MAGRRAARPDRRPGVRAGRGDRGVRLHPDAGQAGQGPDQDGVGVTIERTAGFEDKPVPAARMLPSNAEYLEHLALSGGEGVIRLASNENTDRLSPAVARALARAFEDANLSPPPISPLARELALRHAVEVEQVLVTAGSTEVIDATLRTFLRAGDEVVIPAPSWPVCRRRLQALEASIVEVPLVCGEA